MHTEEHGRPRIGFVGLGVMGAPMAGHLARAGYALTVFDLNAAASAKLRAQQPAVAVADSPAALAAAADIVVTMLPNGHRVQEVALGAEGLIEGLRPGCLVLDTSSSEPWCTTQTGSALQARGISMVDAPVSGAEHGAIAAELVFMVGGAEADVARARPLLEAMGRQLFHLGPLGAGHAMKSINNLITACTFMATGEGLAIGKRYGLDPKVMNDVLNASTGMSWITRNHIEQRILSRRFDDPFKLELMYKDVNIALEVAGRLGLTMPLSTASQTLWQQFKARSPAGCSVSEIVRVIEADAGVELTPASR